jgi:hypothetical protein
MQFAKCFVRPQSEVPIGAKYLDLWGDLLQIKRQTACGFIDVTYEKNGIAQNGVVNLRRFALRGRVRHISGGAGGGGS